MMQAAADTLADGGFITVQVIYNVGGQRGPISRAATDYRRLAARKYGHPDATRRQDRGHPAARPGRRWRAAVTTVTTATTFENDDYVDDAWHATGPRPGIRRRRCRRKSVTLEDLRRDKVLHPASVPEDMRDALAPISPRPGKAIERGPESARSRRCCRSSAGQGCSPCRSTPPSMTPGRNVVYVPISDGGPGSAC